MFENTFIVFAFVTMVSWAVGDFLLQRVSRTIGHIEALLWVDLIGSIVLFPFVFYNGYLSQIWSNFPFLLVLGLLEFIFGLSVLNAYEKGKLTVVEVILTFELPLTILLGVVVFGERINLFQSLLILTIFLGIVGLSRRSPTWKDKIKLILHEKKGWLEKGALVALFAALMSALYNFFVAFNVKNAAPLVVIWFPWTVSSIILIFYIVYKKGLSDCFKKANEHKKLILLGSLFDVVAWLSFATALSQEDLSITTAITEGYPALAIFLALKYNGEKVTKHQLIIASIVILATVAMALIN